MHNQILLVTWEMVNIINGIMNLAFDYQAKMWASVLFFLVSLALHLKLKCRQTSASSDPPTGHHLDQRVRPVPSRRAEPSVLVVLGSLRCVHVGRPLYRPHRHQRAKTGNSGGGEPRPVLQQYRVDLEAVCISARMGVLHLGYRSGQCSPVTGCGHC